jgi:hypothetical protein
MFLKMKATKRWYEGVSWLFECQSLLQPAFIIEIQKKEAPFNLRRRLPFCFGVSFGVRHQSAKATFHYLPVKAVNALASPDPYNASWPGFP